MKGLQWNYMEGSGVMKGKSYQILVAAWITMLIAQSEKSAITQQIMSGFWWNFQPHSAMTQGTIDNWRNVWSALDHHADSPNRKPGQYGGNELPWRRCDKYFFPLLTIILQYWGSSGQLEAGMQGDWLLSIHQEHNPLTFVKFLDVSELQGEHTHRIKFLFITIQIYIHSNTDIFGVRAFRVFQASIIAVAAMENLES